MRIPLVLPMFILGLAGLAVTVPETSAPPATAEPPKRIKPLSERMGCPQWTEGHSRTVLVMLTESRAGLVVDKKCVRPKEETK